jgi:subtilase family serine protease
VKPIPLLGSRRGAVLAAGTAGSLALLSLAAAGPASATAPAGPAGKVPVAQGLTRAILRGAHPAGQTPDDKPERVSFVLRPRNLAGLETQVAASMPGGPLTASQFAASYGQTPANVAALRRYLSQFGIRTDAYRDGLDVRATGTVGQFNDALAIQQDSFRLPATKGQHGAPGRPAMTVHSPRSAPLLPVSLARFVLAVFGLTTYPPGTSNAVHRPALATGAQPAATQKGDLTPADVARRYNLAPLYRQGFTGRGQTIGIITLASLRPSDAEFFWHHTLHLASAPGRIRLVNVDGGSGPVSDANGSGETTLDVEQSGALAPGAKVVVYQAPNSDAGFTDAYFQAASENVADTVSTSWGEAEDVIDTAIGAHQETPAFQAATDLAFLELGAQGQSNFVAQGDAGAFDDSDELGSTDLNVDNPGDSAWTTSAGGTTLPGRIPLSKTDSARIPRERAWSWDWLWPHWKALNGHSEASFAFSNALGGGGGYSQDEPMPGYQTAIPGITTFRGEEWLEPAAPKLFGPALLPSRWIFHPHPAAVSGTSRLGRGVPDLSTNADPETGFEEYFTGFQGSPLETGWGGTSFVAPQLNGAAAVINEAVGHRVGFWNPLIYRFAAGPGSPLHPLSQASPGNTNLFYTGSPGRVWNPATGLGTPDFAALARAFRHA